jgi:hypothetical protein
VPNSSGSIDLGALPKEDQEALERMAEETGTEPKGEKRKVLTAFLVIANFDGNTEVLAFQDDDLEVHAHPTPDLIYGACSTLIKDLEIQESAQAAAHMTAQVMLQQARAIAEQQQAASIRQGLGL